MVNRKAFLSNSVQGILSQSLPIFILQFVILPLLGNQLDALEYGALIVAISLVNLSGTTLGNVLNNSRLLIQKTYSKKNIVGDYNIILLGFVLLNSAVVAALLMVYLSPIDGVYFQGLLFLSIILIINGYLSVEFRIKLDYRSILYEASFLGLGYGLGYYLYTLTEYWPFIYITGFFCSCGYLISKTSLLREPFRTTPMFGKALKLSFTLLCSGLLLSAGIYLDKLILFPLLGAEAVAIYYVGSILGRSLGLVIGPISGVLLSYFSREEQLSNKNFYGIVMASAVTGIFSYIFIILIDDITLNYLYPKYADEALNYTGVITLGIVLYVMSNVINSASLSFLDRNWQLVINGFYVVGYLILCFTLSFFYGFSGFCFGLAVASLTRFLLIIYIFQKKNFTV